jgi:hypothetical protein
MVLAPEASDTVALTGRSTVLNGAWTWFSDPRAVVDTDAGTSGPRLLAGAVTAVDGPGGGDVVVLWYDSGTGETGYVVLHESFEQDDHDGPALFVRPDGRYLAMYARHSTDSYTRWRVSTGPHDPTAWESERTLDNGAGATYCNVYRLADDGDGAGRTYCFTRSANWDPNVLVSTDDGSTWRDGGRLLTRGDGSVRPYLRYGSDGRRVHLTATEDHPHQYDNGVYHGFVEDGALFDSRGNRLAESVVDGGDSGDAPTPEDLTTVFESGTTVGGERLTTAWTVDVSVAADGHPVVLFQARVDGDADDHRFCYARFDGDGWRVSHLARAGPGLYETEFDYTGLAAVDPGNADRVVLSTPVDPRDGTALDHYELFAGETPDGGETWQWTALTPDARTDNLRPVLPAWEDGDALLWLRGDYHTYEDWETDVVARMGRSGR